MASPIAGFICWSGARVWIRNSATNPPPPSLWCANLLNGNVNSMWSSRCFAFSLKMRHKNEILIATVIKSFMFLRPSPLAGEERRLLSFRGLVLKVARLFSCPVARVGEAEDLCLQGVFLLSLNISKDSPGAL